MCGLSFVVNSQFFNNSTQTLKQNSLFADMLLASAVRGTDSTGVFQIAQDGNVWYGKLAAPSGIAIKDDTISALIGDVHRSPITVGHVRAATAGKVSDDNAHPFIAHKNNATKDYIIGVHNGTLYGWEHSDMYNLHDVDSSWAMSEIATRGVDAFNDFYGAYAFLWYDTEQPGTLFIARNDERSLYIARSKNKETIVGASEAGMLQWLAQRNGIELEEDVPFFVDSGFLFSIDTTEQHLSIKLIEELPEYATYTPANNTVTTNSMLPYTPSPITPTVITSTSYEKNRVAEAVKDALRNARMSVVKPEEDDGPIEMGPTELLTRAKDDWFNDADVDEAARKSAMYDGSYGSIVVFDPVELDEYTDSIVGEIVYPSFYKQPITYLENVSPFEWGDYENRQHNMVVAGVKWFNNEKEYIVVPLNEKGLEAIAV